jgi:hypothetical protein
MGSETQLKLACRYKHRTNSNYLLTFGFGLRKRSQEVCTGRQRLAGRWRDLNTDLITLITFVTSSRGAVYTVSFVPVTHLIGPCSVYPTRFSSFSRHYFKPNPSTPRVTSIFVTRLAKYIPRILATILAHAT